MAEVYVVEFRKGRRTIIGYVFMKIMEFLEYEILEITVEYGLICIRKFDSSSVNDRPYVGVIRQLGDQNRIVIPIEYYNILGIEDGDQLIMYVEDNTLKIRKVASKK